MSDGNYNRNLLPYTQYTSGVKAGRAQMKTSAAEAFKVWYAEAKPTAGESEIKAELINFLKHLNA